MSISLKEQIEFLDALINHNIDMFQTQDEFNSHQYERLEAIKQTLEVVKMQQDVNDFDNRTQEILGGGNHG